MATESKIKAKRENTKKSNGPSKFKDKQKSSMNALIYGILKKSIKPYFKRPYYSRKQS